MNIDERFGLENEDEDIEKEYGEIERESEDDDDVVETGDVEDDTNEALDEDEEKNFTGLDKKVLSAEDTIRLIKKATDKSNKKIDMTNEMLENLQDKMEDMTNALMQALSKNGGSQIEEKEKLIDTITDSVTKLNSQHDDITNKLYEKLNNTTEASASKILEIETSVARITGDITAIAGDVSTVAEKVDHVEEMDKKLTEKLEEKLTEITDETEAYMEIFRDQNKDFVEEATKRLEAMDAATVVINELNELSSRLKEKIEKGSLDNEKTAEALSRLSQQLEYAQQDKKDGSKKPGFFQNLLSQKKEKPEASAKDITQLDKITAQKGLTNDQRDFAFDCYDAKIDLKNIAMIIKPESTLRKMINMRCIITRENKDEMLKKWITDREIKTASTASAEKPATRTNNNIDGRNTHNYEKKDTRETNEAKFVREGEKRQEKGLRNSNYGINQYGINQYEEVGGYDESDNGES